MTAINALRRDETLAREATNVKKTKLC